ncbi:MAG: hypothetical protein JSR46_07085 [Verrucomicrobia bacterium]|nr:hypothetical protein [Verrucomicrobiota bacterium]
MNHIHFTDSSSFISAMSSMLAVACEQQPAVEETRYIPVAGVQPLHSSVKVVEYIIKIAAEKLSRHKTLVLQLLPSREDLLCLSLMELMRKKNRISSCERIAFNEQTDEMEVTLRKSASLATQQVVAAPPAYFGPFEELCEVAQGQFALSSATSSKPILATWHLADCIAAIGVDREAKVGFLFHFEQCSNVPYAIKQLMQRLGQQAYRFEYCILGGVTGLMTRTQEEIEKYFERAAGSEFRFEKRDACKTLDIPFADFMVDSYWSRSVRLCRSIAIDLRMDDPLGQFMGYEPEINPNSIRHTSGDAYYSSSRMKCIFEGP